MVCWATWRYPLVRVGHDVRPPLRATIRSTICLGAGLPHWQGCQVASFRWVVLCDGPRCTGVPRRTTGDDSPAAALARPELDGVPRQPGQTAAASSSGRKWHATFIRRSRPAGSQIVSTAARWTAPRPGSGLRIFERSQHAVETRRISSGSSIKPLTETPSLAGRMDTSKRAMRKPPPDNGSSAGKLTLYT